MADTKTGSSKARLVEDAVHDLETIQEDVADLVGRCELLQEEARGLNGLSNCYKAWRTQLEELQRNVEEEASRFRKKMLGPDLTDSIESTVEAERAEAVAEARS